MTPAAVASGPRRRPGPRAAAAPPGSAARAASRLAWAAVAALAVLLLDRLVPQAARAVLAEDECFHAAAAHWIAAHGRLPERLPEFYGGLFYSYPPLLHLLGAAWTRLFAGAALPLLSLTLHAGLGLALAGVPAPGIAGAARRWALWLVLPHAALATYGVRFYAETLACLLGVVVALLFLRLAANGRARDGALLGLAGGLALLAKNTALVVPLLLLAFVVVAAVRRRGDAVRAGLLALAVALAVAAPMLVRNQTLFGSAVYPGLAPDADPWLAALNHARFGVDPRRFARGVAAMVGAPLIVWGALAAAAAVRRRHDAATGLLAAAAAGVGLALLSPHHEARHLLPLVPIVALAGAVVLHDVLRPRPRAAAAVEVALAGLALAGVLGLGDVRTRHDPPASRREAFAAVRARVPEGETVLSLWTYETAWHGGRPATWPIPWGQADRGPATLFRERDPDRFRGGLDRLGIRWLLLVAGPGADRFDSANYPATLVACVEALIARGELREAWRASGFRLVGRATPADQIPASSPGSGRSRASAAHSPGGSTASSTTTPRSSASGTRSK